MVISHLLFELNWITHVTGPYIGWWGVSGLRNTSPPHTQSLLSSILAIKKSQFSFCKLNIYDVPSSLLGEFPEPEIPPHPSAHPTMLSRLERGSQTAGHGVLYSSRSGVVKSDQARMLNTGGEGGGGRGTEWRPQYIA